MDRKTMQESLIRVRGLVQGVGFRPAVWRIARACRLRGDVRNDGHGVLIRVQGESAMIDRFCVMLEQECPPLARIDRIERQDRAASAIATAFEIVGSDAGNVRTAVVADAATCQACAAEIADPQDRRYRYPFTNCTHCGPRLTIVQRIPYDRRNTSMAAFAMCPACQAEYDDPADRRFHAQPNACPACGPRLWLVDADGDPVPALDHNIVESASRLLADGAILAVKGIGGFHLACDAGNSDAVTELRRRKGRFDKPFALMARDLAVVRAHSIVDDAALAALTSSASPIVLCPPRQAPDAGPLASAVAPGQAVLGFMLPYSPLHHRLLQTWDRPLVMTSGNLSEEPQCIDNTDAQVHLSGLADYYLLHDRDIVNRVDDSVVRVMHGAPRLLRRARGYAPNPITLPDGFADCRPVLALGGELKSTICLLRDGDATLTQHLGDLENARTADEFERTVRLYQGLFEHHPDAIAVDLHPDYRSHQFGQTMAERLGLPLISIQHHYAHIASVLADNGWPTDAGQVLGIALDGLGLGNDGTLWGGEFLLADYRGFTRLGHLVPVAMPGGTRAIIEPWRNTLAQLVHHIGWDELLRRYPRLELTRFLTERPSATLIAMIKRGFNSPISSSCGRLFDAVAAAVGVCRAAVSYEGQAAVELEALASSAGAHTPDDGYPFGVRDSGSLVLLDTGPLWPALLDDLSRGEARARIAARFHAGLGNAVVRVATELATRHQVGSVALSGGVLQNKYLFETIASCLEADGFDVLSHGRVPANDGGLALGQAAIAAMQ